jgi:hypothetical protein
MQLRTKLIGTVCRQWLERDVFGNRQLHLIAVNCGGGGVDDGDPRGPRRVPPALSRLPAFRSPGQRLPPYRDWTASSRAAFWRRPEPALASLNVFRFDLCFVTNNWFRVYCGLTLLSVTVCSLA